MFRTFSFGASFMSLLRIMLSNFKHRSRIGIVVDILDTVMRAHPRGKTKTQIMRGARLSYDQASRYLDLLMLCDYIRGENSSYGDRALIEYCLTADGFHLFKQLHTLHVTLGLLGHKSV